MYSNKIITMKNKSKILIIALFLLIGLVKSTEAQWVQCNGPYGGDVSALAVNGTKVFAEINSGEVYQSNDNGANWTVLSNGQIYARYNEALAIKDDTVFVGSEQGVFKSTIYDSNWTTINNGLANYNVLNLSINGNKIYAGTDNGLFVSNNNGASWTSLNNGNLSSPVITSIIFDGNDIYVSTGGKGVYVSSNNGLNWNQLNNGLSDSNIRVIAKSGNNIYAGTYSNGIFISTNNGASWIPTSSGSTGYNNPIYAIAFSGSKIILGTNRGIYISNNNGISWAASNNGIGNISIKSLVISGNYIFAGTYMGVYRSSNNGNSWQTANTGIKNTSINTFSEQSNKIITLSAGAIFSSINNGQTWNQFNIPNKDVYTLAVKGNRIYAGVGDTYSGGIYLSTDSCTSWVTINNGIDTTYYVYLIGVRDSLVVAATGHGIYVSLNYGNSWVYRGSLTSVNAISFHDNYIFVSTLGHGIYRSYNLGYSWNLANSGLCYYTFIPSFAVNGNTIFAGSYEDISKSTNNGASWTGISPCGYLDAESIAISGNKIFIGTYLGVYMTVDNGSNWIPITEGYTPKLYATVQSLMIKGNNIFAGSVQDGVWRRSLTEQDTITTISNQNSFGTTTGGGIYTLADSCTVKAFPNPGYAFIYWTLNGDTVSYDSNYTFIVTKNKNLVAHFISDTTHFTITVIANPNECGTTTGGGTFTVNQNATISAHPTLGAYFNGWAENNYYISYDTVYKFPVVANWILTANFDWYYYLISGSVNPTSGGTISGDLSVNNFCGIYKYDSICNLIAVPDSGYTFTNWTENGNIVSTNNYYSFNVTNNRDLIANFNSLQGIEVNFPNKVLSIYPNPTSSTLTIETNSNTKQNLEIVNLLGQTMYTYYIYSKATVDVSALPKGIYLIKLNTDKGIVVKKFVKE